MNDMTLAITPKSDQLNSDDLITGPRTIRITDIQIRSSTEQPVSIYFEGDNGKPFKPCKSMSRVMVAAWGPDASKYIGRSMTIYRDPSVKWAGMEVGGIRISHLTDIERDMVMALTATKGKRALYTVRPLVVADVPAAVDVTKLLKDFESCETQEQFGELEAKRGVAWKVASSEEKAKLKKASDDAKARVTMP